MSLPGVQVKMEISMESKRGDTAAESSTDDTTSADTGSHADIKHTKEMICLMSVVIFAVAKVQNLFQITCQYRQSFAIKQLF